jgi:hypothetical protein
MKGRVELTEIVLVPPFESDRQIVVLENDSLELRQ